jgi:hypothetical protein
MEPTPLLNKCHVVVRLASPLMAVTLLIGAGCVGADKIKNPFKSTSATVQPAQAVAAWSNKVVYAPDPLRGGAAVPYLMGRLYLFGPELGAPLVGDGSLIVDLYDQTPRGAGSEPVMLQEQRYDPETLKRLVKEDLFGMGYTVYLPWLTYRPDITQVNLILRYDPAKGPSLLHQSGAMTVDHAATKELQALQAKGQGPPMAQTVAAGGGK